MAGNSTHHFTNTAVLAVERCEATEVVPSRSFDRRLADTYRRARLRGGMLENLVGVRERRWWDEGTTFTDGAADAGRAALWASGVAAADIGLMINTSVSRHWLEPATSVVVHDAIGLSTSCQNFDITNACLGFLNGIEVAGAMIDAGLVDYALVVDGEDSRRLQETTLERLAGPTTTAAEVMAEFAALTLGSGAVAMVLGPADRHPEGHRVVAAASRAGTEHHALCVGDDDHMLTDLRGLLDAGLDLSQALWEDAAAEFDWGEGMARYFIHQVSQVHTDAICQRLEIDPALVPRTFPTFGNIGPASVVFTLAGEQASLERGDRILMMGIGSGLNACCLAIDW
ncbi:3-oxoacyl-ACP synthase III [Nocardioides marinquilinus]|uniref:3-oxoacyl-ACP synthase III n=1 Tax=Nocardioides marinquilinus TaxID=1210400 RepID=A0ABP9PUU8_9ACTN